MHDHARRLTAAAFALLTCACAREARADAYHYTNILVGDRAAGMAGAYTAVSDDATGLYYNPAGIVYSSGRNLSASVNAVSVMDETYKGAVGGNDWKRSSSSLLPNYFGVIQPLGPIKVGISYAVPDAITSDQRQSFQSSGQVIDFNQESKTYMAGPSIAAELADGLSAGLTLYWYQKNALTIMNQVLTRANSTFAWQNNYLERTEEGVRPILGLMYAPADKVSLGLAVSSIYDIWARTSLQQSAQDTQYPSQNVIPPQMTGDNTLVRYPTQISLGAAWFPTSRFLLSAEADYSTGVGYQPILQRDIRPVLNGAVGGEYYFTSSLAGHAGFYTNFSNTSRVDSSKTGQPEHVDLYGGTLSLSAFTRSAAITLGGAYTYGQGRAQILADQPAIQTAVINGWMLYLAASYSY